MMTRRRFEGDSGTALARAQGAFYLISGVWPLVSMRSFEAVVGPKVDRWLVYTVAGLLVTTGWAQLLVPSTDEGTRTARRLGVGCASTLLAVDLTNAPTGRISRIYLVDAVMEVGWLAAWASVRRRVS